MKRGEAVLPNDIGALNNSYTQEIVRRALQEDLGFGDLTSSGLPAEQTGNGLFTAKADGVLAGLGVVRETYRQISDHVSLSLLLQDGDAVTRGQPIARAEGPSRALLQGERVALNFLQHLSGIATQTKHAVDALDSGHTRICDTRKTLPGLRMLQKYAVRCGGGYNHRYRLDDGIMIKDNHIKAAGSITAAVEYFRSRSGPMVTIEVETETEQQVIEAVEAGADIIMLDNRTPEQVQSLLKHIPASVTTEVSGGITPETIGGYRDTGVDFISMGSLTHSVTALDISFNLQSQ